jgi:hypothetical protein
MLALRAIRPPFTRLITPYLTITHSFIPTTSLLHRRSFVSEIPPTSTPPPHQRPRFLRRAIAIGRYSGYFLLSSAFGVLAIGAGIFIHDAFTYSDKHLDRVPVSPLALNPERGGPKNLPIVKVMVDDEEDEENVRIAEKPRLVIVGGGWGVCRPCLFSSSSSV